MPDAALTTGAEGVGLLRTELPFLNHRAWPIRKQHAATLVPVRRALTGQVVTARTFDFADDKLPPFLAEGREGGRLGRGLPLMLAQPDAFADQFRSLLSAGADTTCGS
ncbi:putative PEP-binding protein [Streptomyces sp. CGMCC 4.7035]|nr:putative PEP-binding protein [Streptomyces sp. CGMCC 4.7035]WNC02461.1 putative PEP-binding protein [Streptomyces sp. CGMCC 4.7035]